MCYSIPSHKMHIQTANVYRTINKQKQDDSSKQKKQEREHDMKEKTSENIYQTNE